MRTLAWAAREVRLHPGRYLATLLAVALSVALLTATQVFAATETEAVSKRAVLYASQADVIVDSHLWNSGFARRERDGGLYYARTFLDQTGQVQAAEQFSQISVQLSHGGAFNGVMLTVSPRSEHLRWFAPSSGRLPTAGRTFTLRPVDHGWTTDTQGIEAPPEVVLTRQTADALGVRVGDTVLPNVPQATPLTVVGLTDEAGFSKPPAYADLETVQSIGAQLPAPDPALIVNPSATADLTPGSSGNGIGLRLLVSLADPTRAESVVEDVQAKLTKEGYLKIIVQPKTAESVRADAAKKLAAGNDWMTAVLGACGVLALLIGSLIAANTFTILLAQRRRQIGLLRAVGASRTQVVTRFGVEALLIAGVGTAVGVPLGIGLAAAASELLTHSLGFGLRLPVGQLAATVALSIAVTIAAALVPIVRTSRVLPLEALRPEAPSGRRRGAIARGVLCVLLVAAGAGVAASGLARLTPGPYAPGWWVGAGLLAAATGVLLGTSLYVPPLVTLIGRPLAALRPEARLAVGNAVRNPRRVGAMATALVLAVGLIVGVQTAVASGRSSAFAQIDRRYPADLSMQAAVATNADAINANAGGSVAEQRENGLLKGFTPDALATVRSTAGVQDAGLYETSDPVGLVSGLGIYDVVPVATVSADAERLLNAPLGVADGQIGLPAEVIAGIKTNVGSFVNVIPVLGDSASLKVVECNLGSGFGVVTAATMTKLQTPTKPGLMIVRLTHPDDSASVIHELTGRLIGTNPGLKTAGSAEAKASLRAALDGVTALLTGLLAVAALVALVGVGNTLGLSVIERTRESALLRALGLQRAGLRATLLIEALLVTVASIVVGCVLGIAVGWVGAAAVVQQFGLGTPPLTIDWPALAWCCAVVVAAGALASVLPGRAAARATPVEALADVG